MKRTALRIVAVCMVAVAMMAIAGCEKDEDLTKFVTETQSVPSDACRFEITVTTTGGGWRVSLGRGADALKAAHLEAVGPSEIVEASTDPTNPFVSIIPNASLVLAISFSSYILYFFIFTLVFELISIAFASSVST